MELPEAWLGYAVAGTVSGMVGFSDILKRYSSPWRAARYPVALAYVAINLLFGVAAFWLAYTLGFDNELSLAGAAAPENGNEVVLGGLAAGFLAVVILRSVTVTLGGAGSDQTGPKVIVDALLAACDQSIERSLAADKDRLVRRLMRGIDFDDAKVFLPTYCFYLLERKTTADAQVQHMAQLVLSIEGLAIEASMKSYLLGTVLVTAFGFRIAREAVRTYESIPQAPPPKATPSPKAAPSPKATP